MAAYFNAIKSNHVKSKIDQTQQNSKCRLSDDKDETIHHIISEGSKLAQTEYKSRHDCVDSVILWELCKKYEN